MDVRTHPTTGWRRALLGIAALTALALGAACSSDGDTTAADAAATAAVTVAAAADTATAATPAPAPEGYLVVADPAEERLYVYGLPGGDLLTDMDHVVLSAHTGTLVLPDGRFLYIDDHEHQLRVLDLKAEGGPRDAGSAAIPGDQAWSAVDPEGRYYAGSRRDDAKATISVIDLATMQRADIEIDAAGLNGEPHVALGGSPATVYAYIGGTLSSYFVADVMAGNTTPANTLEIGGGAHSQVLARGTLYTSLPERLDAVKVNGVRFGERSEIPWNVDDREGGRNGRMRLSYDGGYIYGAVAASVPAEEWANRVNDVHIADLATGEAKRFELAPGIVGRFSLSQPYALFYNIHPDGDAAYLLDVKPGSATFQEIVARIPLEALTDGPKAGESASGKNARGGTITPDGRWAFVSHGGDGRISIIDTATKAVVGSIETPTALRGGGYLASWTPGTPLMDAFGR
ncbi:MAG: hypothetical protein AMXMBFR23_08210 [Chloroflexota bacterium]